MLGVCSRHPVLRSFLRQNDGYWKNECNAREGKREGERKEKREDEREGTPFSLVVLEAGGEELEKRVKERVIYASSSSSSLFPPSPPLPFSPSLSLSPEEEEFLSPLLSLYSLSSTHPSAPLPWVMVVHEGGEEEREGKRKGERGGVVCFVASHVVVDDVSVGVLLKDLFNLYDNLIQMEEEGDERKIMVSSLQKTFPFSPLFPSQSFYRLSSLSSSLSPSPTDIDWWRGIRVGRKREGEKGKEKEEGKERNNTLILSGFTPSLSLPPSTPPTSRSFHLPLGGEMEREKEGSLERNMNKVCGLFNCSPFILSLSLFLFWKEKINYSKVRGEGEKEREGEGGEGGVCSVIGVPVSERRGGEKDVDVGCFVKILPIPWPIASFPSSSPSISPSPSSPSLSSSLFSHMQIAIPFLHQALSHHSYLTPHQILHLLRSPSSSLSSFPSPFSSSPSDSFDILFAQDENFSLSEGEKGERVGEGYIASSVSLPPSSPKTQAIFFFSWWGGREGERGRESQCGRVELQVDGGGVGEVMGKGLLESYCAFLNTSLSILSSMASSSSLSSAPSPSPSLDSLMKLSLLSPHQKSLLVSHNLPSLLPPHLHSPTPLPPYSPSLPLPPSPPPSTPFSPPSPLSPSFLPSHRIGHVFLRRVSSDCNTVFLKSFDGDGNLGRFFFFFFFFFLNLLFICSLS